MTLPPSLPELEAESDDEQELSRITVLVGGLLIDAGVPSRVSISAIVNDVIDLANDQLPVRAGVDVEFDNPEGKWTFARLTDDAIDPDRSLAEAGVYDGELLVVREVGAPASSSLVDELEGMTESVDNRGRWFAEQRWMAGWFALAVALSAATALLLPEVAVAPLVAGVPIAAVAVLVVAVGCAVAAFVMSFRSGDPRKSIWLAGVSLPLIFGGSLHVVPDAHGVKALPVALALTALVALLQLLGSGRGRPLYTAVIALAGFGVPAALAQLLLNPNPRTV